MAIAQCTYIYTYNNTILVNYIFTTLMFTQYSVHNIDDDLNK